VEKLSAKTAAAIAASLDQYKELFFSWFNDVLKTLPAIMP